MEVYTKILVEGNEIKDIINSDVKINRGDYNATGNFTMRVPNLGGRNKDTFNFNQEVEIYTDTISPPSEKIFTGKVEDINYSGNRLKEEIEISGRDYGYILQEVIANARIFRKEAVTNIVGKIMKQDASLDIIDTSGIDDISVIVEEYTVLGTEYVFDVLKDLAERTNCFFYINENKTLIFKEKGTISSEITLDSSNLESGDTKHTISSVKNYVEVRGGMILTGDDDYFTSDGTGSVYTLSSKPHNTSIFMSGTDNKIKPGGVVEFNDPNLENVKFLVDFSERKVILTSGTVAGDNRLASGESINVDYDKATTAFAVRTDEASIEANSKRETIIINKNIGNMSELIDIANSYVDKNKTSNIAPKNYDVMGLINIDFSKIYKVDLPYHNVNNEDFIILSVTYDLTKKNKLNGKVMKITLGKP